MDGKSLISNPPREAGWGVPNLVNSVHNECLKKEFPRILGTDGQYIKCIVHNLL